MDVVTFFQVTFTKAMSKTKPHKADKTGIENNY